MLNFYSRIKNNNNLIDYISIIFLSLFVAQGLDVVLGGPSFLDFIQNNPPTPLLKYILIGVFVFSVPPWLLRKKQKSDYVVFSIIAIFWFLQNVPLNSLNFSWLPLKDFLTSIQTNIMVWSLYLAWPWQDHIYRFFENIKLYKFVLWSIIVIFFTALVFQLGYKYYNFDVPGHDFALFNQAIDFLSRFELPRSTVRGDLNLWADHFHPILILVALFYKIFKSGYVLVVVQALVLASSIWPLAKLSEKFNFPKILSIAVLLYLPLQGAIAHANGFGFYPEIVAIPFLIWLVWSVFCNQKLLYLFLILTLSGKENMGLYAFAILGIIAIFHKELRKTLIAPIIISLLWSVLAIKVVIPAFNPVGYKYFNYEQLGSNAVQAFATVVTNPLYVLQTVFNPVNKLYIILNGINTPGALFFGGPFALATIPFILETTLASRGIMHVWGFHYQAPLAFATIIAVVLNIFWLTKKYRLGNVFLSALGGAMIIALILSYHSNRVNYYWDLFMASDKSQRSEIQEVLKAVPSNNSLTIVAQDTLVAYFSDKPYLYQYPDHKNQADILVFALDRSSYPLARKDLLNDVKNYLKNNRYKVLTSNKEAIMFIKTNVIASQNILVETNGNGAFRASLEKELLTELSP